MSEWDFLPYSTILSVRVGLVTMSCVYRFIGNDAGVSGFLFSEFLWFRLMYYYFFIIIILLFTSFFFIRPTDRKLGNAFDAKRKKKRGWPDRAKKNTVFVSAESGALQSCLFVESGYFFMFLIFLFFFFLVFKIEASDIYEVPLTNNHDTEKLGRFNKHWENIFYCTIMNFPPRSANYDPPFPSLSNSVATSRPVAYQVFIG